MNLFTISSCCLESTMKGRSSRERTQILQRTLTFTISPQWSYCLWRDNISILGFLLNPTTLCSAVTSYPSLPVPPLAVALPPGVVPLGEPDSQVWPVRHVLTDPPALALHPPDPQHPAAGRQSHISVIATWSCCAPFLYQNFDILISHFNQLETNVTDWKSHY